MKFLNISFGSLGSHNDTQISPRYNPELTVFFYKELVLPFDYLAFCVIYLYYNY